ncbi:UNVERIFIED_CONTAM: hypothetical protein FKN15_021096 [Acipenser sinensis]
MDTVSDEPNDPCEPGQTNQHKREKNLNGHKINVVVEVRQKGVSTCLKEEEGEELPVPKANEGGVAARGPKKGELSPATRHTGSLARPPTAGAHTRAAMVESTGGNCASPTASAPSMEASAAVLLDMLGAEAGCFQEDLTSFRKSGNAGKGWGGGGVEVCAGLKTDLRCSELSFQGTWRKLEALSISAQTKFEGAGISGSEASSELGPIT